MKFIFFLYTLSLLSCKKEAKSDIAFNPTIQKKEKEIVVKPIDTIPFIEFLERFITEKEFQKESHKNNIPENVIYRTNKDFVAYLNADTLSLFEQKLPTHNPQALLSVNFKTHKNFRYSFSKKEEKWCLDQYQSLSNNQLPEKDFIAFLMHFSKDSLYQKNHIVFPLKEYTLDNDYETVFKKISKENWIHFNLTDEIENLLYFSNIDSQNLYRNIYYRGINNGIMLKLTFQKIREEWFLIKTEDYST